MKVALHTVFQSQLVLVNNSYLLSVQCLIYANNELLPGSVLKRVIFERSQAFTRNTIALRPEKETIYSYILRKTLEKKKSFFLPGKLLNDRFPWGMCFCIEDRQRIVNCCHSYKEVAMGVEAIIERMNALRASLNGNQLKTLLEIGIQLVVFDTDTSTYMDQDVSITQ